MSHNITVKSTMNDKAILMKALERMNIRYNNSTCNIGNKECSLNVDKRVGFYQDENQNFVITGDPYYSSQMKKYYNKTNRMRTDILMNYNIVQADDMLASQGFQCTENQEAKVGSDGLIQMVYTWG